MQIDLNGERKTFTYWINTTKLDQVCHVMVGTERRVVCCLKIYLRDHWSITLLTKLSWGGGGRSWRESTTTMTVRLDHALLSGLTLFIFMTFSLIASFFK